VNEGRKLNSAERIGSFFRVAVESVGEAMAGNSITVNERLHAQRMRECVSCPQLSRSGTCGLCGCIVAMKTRVKAASCPAGKW
jgi:hypothetical protein